MFLRLEKITSLTLCEASLHYPQLQTPFPACRWQPRSGPVAWEPIGVAVWAGGGAALRRRGRLSGPLVFRRHTLLQPTHAPHVLCVLLPEGWGLPCSRSLKRTLVTPQIIQLISMASLFTGLVLMYFPFLLAAQPVFIGVSPSYLLTYCTEYMEDFIG